MALSTTTTSDAPAASLPRPLLDAARRCSAEAEAQLRDAWRSFGALPLEPGAGHGVDTAFILAELGLDADTLAAGLLLPAVEGTELSTEEIAEDFSPAVAKLVGGAERMASLRDYRHGANAGERADATQIERARKLLVALAEDARVLLIRLAERLALMRRLRSRPPEQREDIAGECLEVYAPLAGRLGIRNLKSELEDLAFRELDPPTYINIARRLDERRMDRERYVARVTRELAGALKAQGIAAEVSGRPKHIYSIWRKMKAKGASFEQVFDLRALRVLVDDVAACYTALGVVHARWRHIPREFDDYIATPKPNRYQSLHTALIGPEGKTLEVQIRTHEMHEHAEFGVAAHWRYKEGAAMRDRDIDARIEWLKHVLEEPESAAGSADFLDQLRSELFSYRVYAMTPRGKILDLPAGATALDFAYQIHTDVGHRCRGAKVNGEMVQLTRPLESGDRVEILTSRNGTPSRDWLNQHLGYLKTSRARAKVRQWFRLQDHDRNLSAGQEIVNRELRRLGIANADRDALLRRFNYPRFDDLLAAIGGGDVTSGQLASALQHQVPRPVEASPEPLAPPPARPRRGGDVRISGVGDLLTNLAQCCKPIPPESIAGFITRGRGVSIHRKDCSNLLRLTSEDTSRIIDVEWEYSSDTTYPVELRIDARDRKGLLRDITALVANDKINVAALHSRVEQERRVIIEMRVEVTGVAQLSRLIDRVGRVPNVREVRRTG